MNWNKLDARFEGDPSIVQLVNGRARFVVLITVNGVPGVLVNVNWNVPSTNVFAPVSSGGVTSKFDWVTEINSPSTLMLAVRTGLVQVVKEKATTPLVTPLIVSQGWLLVGEKGDVRYSVDGSTGGRTSLPANRPSFFGVGSMNARGNS